MEKKIKKIVLNDYSNHEPYLAATGGKYGFKIIFEKEGNVFKKFHATTAEFPYCRREGRFTDCPCTHSKWCQGFVYVTAIDVLQEVIEWWDTHQKKGCFIDVEYEKV